MEKNYHLGLPLHEMLEGERHPVRAVIWKESESKLIYSGNVLGSLSFPVKLNLSFLMKFSAVVEMFFLCVL